MQYIIFLYGLEPVLIQRILIGFEAKSNSPVSILDSVEILAGEAEGILHVVVHQLHLVIRKPLHK